jgi:Pumilio-family RNA binding repeat
VISVLSLFRTRVVQKLIETLTSRRQINLVISALKPGIIDLMKDLNGNHVVQQCLQSLGGEDNKV